MRALNVCSGAITYRLEIIFTSSLNLKMFSCNPTSELKSFAVNEITQSHFKGNSKENRPTASTAQHEPHDITISNQGWYNN